MSSISFFVVAFSEIFITFWPYLVTRRIFSRQPGIKPAHPAVEGRVLTTGLLAKSLLPCILKHLIIQPVPNG